MASIAKLSRDRRKKGAPYYIQFFDHEGRRRTTKGCPDKGVTEAKAAQIETIVERIKLGLAEATSLDVLLGRDLAAGWESHVKAYEESLERKGNTTKHIRLTASRIRTALNGAGFSTLADFDGDAAEEFISDYCRDGDYGPRTYNHYLQAIEAFGNWLAHPRRRAVERNPFAGIPRRNAATDVRHARRALKPAEMAALIAAARASIRRRQGYDGKTRARIYLLSYMTGLRKGEIASLTPLSFGLDTQQPTVTVEAQYSKHRRKDVLPLHADLVPEIRRWTDGLADDEPLFPKLANRKAYKMIQNDLEEAGIPYETEEGLADFHAAGRHTHITELLRSGVSLAEAKELARHSDVRMTMKYTHIGLEDQARALNQLPTVQKPANHGPETCLHNVCTESGADGQPGTPNVGEWQQDRSEKKRENPRRSKGLGIECREMAADDPDCQKVEAAGIEPASRNISTQASTCVSREI